MRKILSLSIVIALFSGFFLAAQEDNTTTQGSETKVIDITADVVFPYKLDDTTEVMCLVGRFAAQHNGAVITADSAVRYGDSRLECFGNVLINKNTTYAYADRADYNSEINEATLYAPIIKVRDGDATLYTYSFRFNTLDNIGFYDDGGVMINKSNILESERGYYYSDTKELIGVQGVELKSESYVMRGDSVIYNTQTDFAEYFQNTNIWNEDGDYLYADRGEYDKAQERYSVTENGYILTKEQEVWSDSLDYFRMEERLVMRSNIQLDDTTQKALVFGDYVEYWREPGDMIITRDPSVISYDTTQGDSLFMRADTFQVITLNRYAAQIAAADSLAKIALQDSLRRDSLIKAGVNVDSIEMARKPQKPEVQEPEVAVDSLKSAAEVDVWSSLPESIDDVEPRLRDSLMQAGVNLDSIYFVRGQMAEQQQYMEQQTPEVDSTLLVDAHAVDTLAVDSLLRDTTMMQVDSMMLAAADSIEVADSVEVEPVLDTMYRMVKGYRNVKIYRSDTQAVCDSLVATALDSTIRLYINPVMWNEQTNQVSAEEMVIYTENQALTSAHFTGKPIMASKLDDTYYNQVTGKDIYSYFENNELYRTDVEGNAQTLYFMQDDNTREVNAMLVMDSGGATFYIADQTVKGITYRSEPVYFLYPLAMIPQDQAKTFPDFEWQEERRPSEADIFNREVRPSQREERSQVVRPTYAIYNGMETLKRELIKQESWVDREDVVNDAAEQWLNALGYQSGQPRESDEEESEVPMQQDSSKQAPKPEMVAVPEPEAIEVEKIDSLDK